MLLPEITGGNLIRPDTWTTIDNGKVFPTQEDPVDDDVTHVLISATDLVGLFAARNPENQLWVCARNARRNRSFIHL